MSKRMYRVFRNIRYYFKLILICILELTRGRRTWCLLLSLYKDCSGDVQHQEVRDKRNHDYGSLAVWNFIFHNLSFFFFTIFIDNCEYSQVNKEENYSQDKDVINIYLYLYFFAHCILHFTLLFLFDLSFSGNSKLNCPELSYTI